MAHRQLVLLLGAAAAAALAVAAPLAAAADALPQRVPCADPVDVEPMAKFCQQLTKVCVDHGEYVLYDAKHNPRHESFQGLPQIKLDSVHVDYYGFGDVWGTEFLYPHPLIRPATDGEETTELQDPQFTSWCARSAAPTAAARHSPLCARAHRCIVFRAAAAGCLLRPVLLHSLLLATNAHPQTHIHTAPSRS